MRIECETVSILEPANKIRGSKMRKIVRKPRLSVAGFRVEVIGSKAEEREEIKKVVGRILREEKADGKINIVIGDDRFIKKLNRDYRHKDKTTDVLSFEINENGLLGEIYISLPVAKKQAKEYGVSLVDELVRLVEERLLDLALVGGLGGGALAPVPR